MTDNNTDQELRRTSTVLTIELAILVFEGCTACIVRQSRQFKPLEHALHVLGHHQTFNAVDRSRFSQIEADRLRLSGGQQRVSGGFSHSDTIARFRLFVSKAPGYSAEAYLETITLDSAAPRRPPHHPL